MDCRQEDKKFSKILSVKNKHFSYAVFSNIQRRGEKQVKGSLWLFHENVHTELRPRCI